MALTKVTYSMIKGAVYNVLDFGADATGVLESTAAIQSAIDTANAAGGGAVYIPTGTYLCKRINLRNKVSLFGDGMYVSQLIHDPTYNSWMLELDSGSDDPILNFTGVNLIDLGLVNNAGTFSQFVALIEMAGATNTVIERCLFKGFRGDGIYLGGYNYTSATQRHNVNITIKDCVFDGVNAENRNGISVIDCDELLVENTTFVNCSRQDMPGPIDVEPNFNFNVIKNIRLINNTFTNYKSTRAITFWAPSFALLTPPENIEISGNTINLHAGAAFAASLRINLGETVSTSSQMNIVITNNTMENFFINNVCGVSITNNTFINGTISNVGTLTTATLTAKNIIIDGNNFYKSSNSDGCLAFASVDNVTVINNIFEPKDAAAGDRAISFRGSGVTTTSNNISISNNTFIKVPSAGYLFSVRNDGSHTFNTAQNVFANNIYATVGATYLNNFDWRKGDIRYFAAAPTTGTWAVGQYVYNSAPAAGAPQGWVCTVAGTPGTWKAMPNLI